MDSFQKLTSLKGIADKRKKEILVAESAAALRQQVVKRIKTTMIGALSALEESFGFLWEHGKPVETLTEDQEALRGLYDKVRKEILDKGNSQIKMIEKEMCEYTVEKKRFNITLPVKQEE